MLCLLCNYAAGTHLVYRTHRILVDQPARMCLSMCVAVVATHAPLLHMP